MDAETFRKWAHEVVDWIADYRAGIRDHRVLPEVTPGEVKGRLPVAPPEEGEPFGTILEEFRDRIVPGMTHWNHPRFFAYFPANNSAPSILAEMLTAALGAQCMSWQTSPAATELEQVVMEWLRGMLGLPEGFTGVIQDTASTSTLVALLMARERSTGYGFQEEGASAEGAGRLVVYASEEAHSSVEKGVFLAGFGRKSLRRVPVDAEFAMDPAALEQMVRDDVDRGLLPSCVVATTGTTSSTALDPLPSIADVCGRHGLFLHVDAAFAGSAAILPEKRWILDGVERADSFVFNPHKWLLTNFDCSAHFVRDVPALLRTCSIQPEYLRTAHDPEVVNFRDWGVPLGRRFRALKLWFVLRSYGVEGLRRMLREHIRLAGLFRSWVEEHPSFEPAAPTPVSLVCFRLVPPGAPAERRDALNEALLGAVNATGDAFLTHTRLGGRYTLRLSVGQEMTEETDVRAAWEAIRRESDALKP
jgi:aromatic-L-amino-acid decarboxylase